MHRKGNRKHQGFMPVTYVKAGNKRYCQQQGLIRVQFFHGGESNPFLLKAYLRSQVH